MRPASKEAERKGSRNIVLRNKRDERSQTIYRGASALFNGAIYAAGPNGVKAGIRVDGP